MAACTIGQRLSDERTNFLRLAVLVIDGGKLALKTQFDLKFPAQTLGQDLQSPTNFPILKRLGNPPRNKRRILTQPQFDLLFPHLALPPIQKQVDSSDFDVSLLACLIQNLSAFKQQNSPVWTQQGFPMWSDHSLAADVKRLRIYRNQIAHAPVAAMTDVRFQGEWTEISSVIKRLCTTLPGVQTWLNTLENQSIDREMEKEYIDKIKEWEWFDLNLKRGLTELQADFRATVDIVKGDIIKQQAATMKISEDLEKEKISTDANLKSTANALKAEIDKNKSATLKLSMDLEREKVKTDAQLQATADDLKTGVNKCLSATLKLSEDLEKEKVNTNTKLQATADTLKTEINKTMTAAMKISEDLEKEKVNSDTKLQATTDALRTEIDKNVSATSKLSDDLQKEKLSSDKKLKAVVDTFKVEIDRTKSVAVKVSDDFKKEKVKIEALVESQEKEKLMSSQFKALASRSKHYFEELEESDFVETRTYLITKEKIKKTKVIILSGHPGEGKTTMAKHLLISLFPAERCLNIRDPDDWEHIDLDIALAQFEAILIDDIFGCGVFDEALFRRWKRRLPDLALAIRKGLSVIIASRNYILEESKQLLRSVPLFKKENIVFLSSENLSDDEKCRILEAHLRAEKRQVDRDEITNCLTKHSEFQRYMSDAYNFMFGFPQSVNLFAKQDGLFEKGAEYFSRPYAFFKQCIEELYESKENFLALIVLWANDLKTLAKSELHQTSILNQVNIVAERFHFDLDGNYIRCLVNSLNYHAGGLLHFSSETGVYSFSHNVISDVVGLVTAQNSTVEILDFCPRSFLLKYATTQGDQDEFKFYIGEYLYSKLSRKFVQIIHENVSFEGAVECGSSLADLNRGGKLATLVVPNFEIDFSLLQHDAFENARFVSTFFNTLIETGYLQNIMACKIMTVTGFFLNYGIELKDQKYFLLAYSVYLKAKVFANEVIANDILQKTTLSDRDRETEYALALMFAVHYGLLDTVSLLLQRTIAIPEEAVYIAVHSGNESILRLLVERKERMRMESVIIQNNNNTLIVAAGKRLIKSVKCLTDTGYNLGLKNHAGMSALDKAIINKHEDVCEILINAGAPLETRTRKFKRTPLHMAADVGLVTTTRLLLTRGSKVYVKDHKGLFPIHTAALKNNLEIVQILLDHDPSQAALRTKVYGTKSATKGMTTFHIAVSRNNLALLDILLKSGADPNVCDWYGRTAFYNAVLLGKRGCLEMLKGVANVSVPDKNGFTALHEAVYKGDIDAVKCIIQCPMVDVNATDKYGKSPLHIAAENGFSDIFFELVGCRADWRMISNRGDTILHLSVRAKQEKIVNNKTLRDKLSYYIRHRKFKSCSLIAKLIEADLLSSLDKERNLEIDRFNAIHRFAIKTDPSFVLKRLKNKKRQYISAGFTTMIGRNTVESVRLSHGKHKNIFRH